MGQAKQRGTFEQRVEQAQADARAAERMAAANRRMAERIEHERARCTRASQAAPVVVTGSRLTRPMPGRHVALALALAAVAAPALARRR